MKLATGKFFRTGFSLATAAVLFAGSARADYSVQIYQDNVLKGTVTQNSQTTLNLSGYYGTSFDLSGLTLVSTADGFAASLSASGTIAFEGTSQQTLTLIVSDNNVPTPLGGSYVLGSESSYTSVSRIVGYGFQSFAGVGGVLYDMSLASSEGHIYPPGFGGNFTEADEPFLASTPFTLTQVLTYTASPNAGFFNLTGNTTATAVPRAVPEPGSLALLGMGVTGIASFVRRRRHRIA